MTPPKFNCVYMTLCCLTDIDLYQKIHYAIWCFLHTLDRLVRGYKLSWFRTLPRKSRRFIAREQKLIYSSWKFAELALINNHSLAPQAKLTIITEILYKETDLIYQWHTMIQIIHKICLKILHTMLLVFPMVCHLPKLNLYQDFVGIFVLKVFLK